MSEEIIKIGVANEGELSLSVNVLKEWKPTNVTQFSDTVFFKVDDKYYSMKAIDFRKLYT